MPRAAFVVAEFNREIVDAMVDGALAEAKQLEIDVGRVARVPGSYEVPLIAQQLLRSSDVDFVVVLGFIERGETLHGEVMGHVVHQALMKMSLESGKPIGLGIIGPGATLAQAMTRKDSYGRAAVKAAFEAWRALSAK